MSGARVIHVRARVIELLTRTVLSAEDIAGLLEGALGDSAPSRTVVEADIAIASGAGHRPMNALRWAIYQAFLDFQAAGDDAPGEVAIRRALADLTAADPHLRKVAERDARMRVRLRDKDLPIDPQIATYSPDYYRARMRVYLRAVREHSKNLFALRLHDDGAAFRERIDKLFSTRQLQKTSGAPFEARSRTLLKRALELWRETRRSSLNLASPDRPGHLAKGIRGISAGELAVNNFLLGQDLKGVPIWQSTSKSERTARRTSL